MKNNTPQNEANRSQLKTLLVNHPDFLNADANEIEQMTSFAIFRTFPAGSYLYEEGNPVNYLFFIMEGSVNINCFRKDESIQNWGNVAGGNIISVYEMYRHNRVHSESARCIQETLVAMFPINDYFNHLLKLNSIAAAMLKYMAFIVEDCIQDILCVSAADKISLYFKRQMVYFKRCEISDGVIKLFRDHLYNEIADMTRCTRETVNRELKKMEKEGKLKLTKTHIIISDPSVIG